MKAVLFFDWSSFRLNHAAMKVDNHLMSLGVLVEDRNYCSIYVKSTKEEAYCDLGDERTITAP